MPVKDGSRLQARAAMKLAESSGSRRYFTGKPCRRGHIAERWLASRVCVECQAETSGTACVKDRKAEYLMTWYAANRDDRMLKNKANYQANRHVYIARSRARQQSVRQQTPAWADLYHIRDFYDLARIAGEHTGFEFHVDHIVPLQGERVSGLHVPENLSVLLAEHNRAKRNKFNV